MRPQWLLVWLACLLTPGLADNDTQPISIFRSVSVTRRPGNPSDHTQRPDLVAPILTVLEQKRERQAPGFYFVAPYQQIQESIHIFDNDANLVYTGFGSVGPGICHAPQVCMYKSERHLCFYQGTQMIGWGHGHGVIMDKHYRIVKSIEPGSYQASSDMHEFMVIEDGRSALMTQYLRSVYDLCPWDLCDGLGYIQQGAFQEVDVETGAVNFEWRSLDHVDPSESYVGPSTTEISGSGENPESPWDYFHINSIDKNQDGDYLISARHTSCVYKISGKDGHIIWRLNGLKSDYYLDGFSFSSQHDARWVSDNEDETVVSLFDNGSNGFNETQPYSTGQIIKLDHKTKVATAILNLEPPLVDGRGHMSKSQGNMQQLPNGNILMGWGNDAFWTEYSGKNHEVVFYGALGWSNVMNYRVHKFEGWVGVPLTKPALWTYSKTGQEDETMWMYVSWNGATEVKHWQFYTSDSNAGPWKPAGSVLKHGFETAYEHHSTATWTYVEALDRESKVLGKSLPQLTFTPNSQLREYCDDLACRFMPNNDQRKEEKAEAQRQREEEERREREEREEAKRRKERNAIIYGSVVGGVAALIVVVVVLSTKNMASRPINAAIMTGWNAIRRRQKTEKGSGYKALALEDQNDDRAPMITDGS